jgi:hypothetical protein
MPAAPKNPVIPPVAPDTPSPTADRPVKPKRTAIDRRTVPGVWVHYNRLPNLDDAIAVSLHADELASRTAAMDALVPGKVVFVPWDGSIEAALLAATK